jgi:hypothetical protein
MGMILTVAAMRVNHRDIASLEDFTSHFTIEIIEALRAVVYLYATDNSEWANAVK